MWALGAFLGIAGGLVLLGCVSYVFILSREVNLVVKIASLGGGLGLVMLGLSVLRERLSVRCREGLDEVKP